MIVLICVLSLIVALGCVILYNVGASKSENKFLYNFYYYDEVTCGVAIVATVIFIIGLITMILIGSEYSQIKIIDDEIKLYQTENNSIENSVNSAVSQYMDYESSTFSDLKVEDPTVVLAMYPELKTNELVSKQIEIYVDNNNKIKSLKSKKLKLELYGWWLFFK